MIVALIDYGSGNLRSAAKAFERAASEAGVSAEIHVTTRPEVVAAADRIVLPGVGAFADCHRGLKLVDGVEDALIEAVTAKGRPFLGICVGMQLMASRGLEYETSDGLGWIPGDVVRIEPTDAACKIPHMGWNTLKLARPHPVFEGIDTGDHGLHAYFVHSFHLKAENDDHVVALTDHGGPVTAVVARDNLVGTQFHPEKSQSLGLTLIGNFLKWKP